jgi:hypothetical protein
MSLSEQFSNQMEHHLISPVVLVLFWTGSFLIVGWEEGLIPWPPHSPDLTRLYLLFCVFMKDVICCEESAKYE